MRDRADTDTGTAASEVVAYVIIVAIVFVVFGLIFFNVTSIFASAGDSERVANAERGLEILQSNAERVVFGGTPRRTTEFPIGGGSVSVGGEQVRVNVTVVPDSGEAVSRNRTLSPVRYELGNDVLLYENGGVITASEENAEGEENSVMASDPGWVVRPDAVAVQTVRTFGVGSVGGGQTATVETESAGNAFTEAIPKGESGNVTVEVFSGNSPSQSAWSLYMERLSSRPTVVGVTEGPNSVEIRMEIDNSQRFVYVEKPVRVEVR